MTDLPRVGISQCLLGDEVRYDGGHKRDENVLGFLDEYFAWVPVCPEVEVGMGIPREPVQDEKRLGDPDVRETFIQEVYEYQRSMSANSC